MKRYRVSVGFLTLAHNTDIYAIPKITKFGCVYVIFSSPINEGVSFISTN
jgi:hypothetical protein